MKRNTAALWDQVWADRGLVTQDQLILANEKASRRWQIIEEIISQSGQRFKHLSVIELGCGSGTYSALFAQQGASVTVVDYSKTALKRTKEFYQNNQLRAKRVEADALHLPKALLGTFDVSLSVGLAEHFIGKKRRAILQSHLAVLKPNGLAILIVPNAFNPPYRIYKFVATKVNRWIFGEEFPFTHSELRQLAQSVGATDVTIKGDEFYSSIKFLLPANFLRRWFRVGLPTNAAKIRREKPSIFDNSLGYNLIVALKK